VSVYHLKVHPVGAPPGANFPDLLQARGPYVDVELRVPPALAASLAAAGKPVPAPINGPALLDTGASVSCVDKSVPPKLGLNPVGTTILQGAKGGGPSSLFPMRLEIQVMKWTIDYSNMVEADLAALGYLAIIGRDVLRLAQFVYHGHVGEYTLSN
jgi:hypothetical protein